MKPSRPPTPNTIALWVFFAVMIPIVFFWWIIRSHEYAPPPAVPSIPGAHQAPAAVAPPKNVPVGRHVMAAIQANEKDVKKPTTPQ